jgi:hypothetical protein
MKKPISVCPFCQKQNPITILADIVKYYCKHCSCAYMVKREVIFTTITPGLLNKEEAARETLGTND